MQARELLQRDVPIEVALPRQVDDGRRAAPDLADDLVPPHPAENLRLVDDHTLNLRRTYGNRPEIVTTRS